MPVIQASQTVVHEVHGTSFTSYVRPASGSGELCGWRVEVPARTEGVAHRVSREEVLYLLSGTLRVEFDGDWHNASAGDAIVVPAGSVFRVDNLTGEPASAWVTTTVGFGAVLPDGSWLAPPWTT